MRNFDLNKLEIEHLENPKLNDYFVDAPMAELGLDDTVDDAVYDSAVALQESTLERLNDLLHTQGSDFEIVRADMIDYFDFMLVRRDETESEFALRMFGSKEVDTLT